ncbi:MAG: hypothetical protein ACI8TS_001283, partial [Flavobacteriales bacterium]
FQECLSVVVSKIDTLGLFQAPSLCKARAIFNPSNINFVVVHKNFADE